MSCFHTLELFSGQLLAQEIYPRPYSNQKRHNQHYSAMPSLDNNMLWTVHLVIQSISTRGCPIRAISSWHIRHSPNSNSYCYACPSRHSYTFQKIWKTIVECATQYWAPTL
ncbi:hypothetical protein Mapa_013369 [Marchantia paleacea]|nr:hypothetical protein Mapa_013369 [Marchantia paleacea]